MGETGETGGSDQRADRTRHETRESQMEKELCLSWRPHEADPHIRKCARGRLVTAFYSIMLSNEVLHQQ